MTRLLKDIAEYTVDTGNDGTIKSFSPDIKCCTISRNIIHRHDSIVGDKWILLEINDYAIPFLLVTRTYLGIWDLQLRGTIL